MKKANLIFGLLLLIAFLISGWYMKEIFKPNNVDNLVARMEIRANHIYLLLVAMLNLISFKVSLTLSSISKYLDIAFRIFLIASGAVTVWAFIYEHTGELTQRTYTFYVALLPIMAIGSIFINELFVYFLRVKK